MSDRTSYRNRVINRKKRAKRRKQKCKNAASQSAIRDKERSNWRIGPGGRYRLGQSAINHIVHGDYSLRPEEVEGRRTGNSELVLCGGLHTAAGWENFKRQRGDVVHLRFFNSKVDKHWYYARSLPNGVITLNIPKQLFQSKAAKQTVQPEAYYKSGYLWKTLFPKTYSKSDIIDVINEALHKINPDESSEGLLIGYARTSHPLTALRIQIQVRGDIINSAFPAWGQPYVGNIGKAYSHLDATSFTMAESTEFFDEIEKVSKPISSKIYIQEEGLSSVERNTPNFIKERPFPPTDNGAVGEWRRRRRIVLKQVAKASSSGEIESLKDYLSDSFIVKDSFLALFQSAEYFCGDINGKKRTALNSLLCADNIIDGIDVINQYDKANRTTHLIDVVEHLLGNRIKYADYLDAWGNKRIHTTLANIVSEYHCDSMIPKYLEALAKSPWRNDLYTEFDLTRYWKQKINLKDADAKILIAIQYKTDVDVNISMQMYIDYILRNMNENYLSLFSVEDRAKFIIATHQRLGEGYVRIMDVVVRLTSSDDFKFFSEIYAGMIDRALVSEQAEISESVLDQILRDYFRVQTANRMKIMLENPDFSLDGIMDMDFESEEFRESMIIKHERRTNVHRLETLLDKSLEYAKSRHFRLLERRICFMKDRVWNERPPKPHRIPKSIEHFYNQRDQSWRRDFGAGLESILQ